MQGEGKRFRAILLKENCGHEIPEGMGLKLAKIHRLC